MLTFAFATAPPEGAAEDRAEKPPNVVILLADDLGYADLGVQGSTEIPTPHIDSLAAGGVRLTNAYVTSPVCGPSRAGLLTGRYPQRFGIRRNEDDMPAEETTIAEMLRAAGYRTGMVGKWHLGSGPLGPRYQGFEEFTGFQQSGRAYQKRIEEYLPLHFSHQANAFIEHHRDEPFFLYVAFSAPHAPVHASQEYMDRFPGIDDPMRRAYVAMVSALDEAVGQILAQLEASGLAGNTLVFFLNDNGGPGVSEKCAAKNASSNAPLRGFKQDLFEGGIRVPFFVRWPERLAQGTVYDAAVSAMDVFTTIGAASGTTLPEGTTLDGVDLLPRLTGTSDTEPHEYLFWSHHDQRAVRRGSWKLVEIDGRPMLFDLSRDLSETNDLAAGHPEITRSLTEALDAWQGSLPRAQPQG